MTFLVTFGVSAFPLKTASFCFYRLQSQPFSFFTFKTLAETGVHYLRVTASPKRWLAQSISIAPEGSGDCVTHPTFIGVRILLRRDLVVL